MNNVNEQNNSKVSLMKETEYIKKMKEDYIYFFVISLIFGISFAFCTYKNLVGLASSLFVIITILCFKFVLKKFEVKLKKSSYFYIITSVLLSFITVYSDSYIIHFFNYISIVFLLIIMMIQQFYDDKNWSFYKYIDSICYVGISSLCCMLYPIEHGINKYKSKKNTTGKFKYVMIGLMIAFPLIFVISFLLLQADDVFQNLIREVIIKIFALDTIFIMSLMIIFGFFAFYCFISGLVLENISENKKEKNKQEPIIAITFTSILTVIYILFCCIQIIFLFSGISLPKGETYSSYARKGFFELLIVSIINFFIIIICNSYFRESKVLKVILTIISICNFIMIASSAYRMILYISEYNLTFLRILVLWFLIVLALLMIGAIIYIYKPKFCLFRYIMFVTISLYIIFGTVKPDYIIADYNLRNSEICSVGDIRYLMNLSLDATPAIKNIEESKIVEVDKVSQMYSKYFNNIYEKYDNINIRTYNFSVAKARDLAKEYLKYE